MRLHPLLSRSGVDELSALESFAAIAVLDQATAGLGGSWWVGRRWWRTYRNTSALHEHRIAAPKTALQPTRVRSAARAGGAAAEIKFSGNAMCAVVLANAALS